MKKLIYLLLITTLSVSCSIGEESDDQGTSDGSATSPVELAVGTAKSGSVAYNDNSFYKFTTSWPIKNHYSPPKNNRSTISISVSETLLPIAAFSMELIVPFKCA